MGKKSRAMAGRSASQRLTFPKRDASQMTPPLRVKYSVPVQNIHNNTSNDENVCIVKNQENIHPNSLLSDDMNDVRILVAKASQLATALDRTQVELERIQNDLSESQNNVSKSAQVAALEASALEIKAKMKALCEKDDEIRAQRDEARSEVVNLKVEIQRMKDQAELYQREFEEERKSFAEERLQLQAQLAHKDKKHKTVEIEADAKINRSIEEAEQRVLKAEAEAAMFKRQLEERRAAVKAGDIRADQLESRVATLQNMLKLAQEEARNGDAVALDLENQLSATENELRALKTTSSVAFERVQFLETRVYDLESSLSDAKSDLESKDWRIEDLLAQVVDLKSALQEAQTEADAARTSAESTRDRLAELATQRTEDIEDGLATLRALEEEVAHLKSAAAKKEVAYRAAQEELVVLRQALENEKSSVPSPSRSITLAKEVATLRATNIQLNENLAKSVVSISAERAVVEALERQLVESEGRVAAAQAERAVAHAECGKLRVALEECKAHVADLVNQLHGTIQEAASFDTSAQEQIQHLQDALEECSTDLAAKEWRIEDLVAQLDDLKDVAMEAQAESVMLQRKIEVLESTANEEIKELRQKTQDLDVQVRVANERTSQLRAKLKETKSNTKRHVKEIKILTQERDALMSSIEELQKALRQSDDSKKTVSEKLQLTQAELTEAQGKIAATESLIDKITAAKAAAIRQGKENATNVPGKVSSTMLTTAIDRQAPLRPRSSNILI